MSKKQRPDRIARDRRPFGHEGQRFVCYWWFVGWWAFSLGLHIDVNSPNIEVHLPFGFVRIGARPKPTRITVFFKEEAA